MTQNPNLETTMTTPWLRCMGPVFRAKLVEALVRKSLMDSESSTLRSGWGIGMMIPKNVNQYHDAFSEVFRHCDDADAASLLAQI